MYFSFLSLSYWGLYGAIFINFFFLSFRSLLTDQSRKYAFMPTHEQTIKWTKSNINYNNDINNNTLSPMAFFLLFSILCKMRFTLSKCFTQSMIKQQRNKKKNRLFETNKKKLVFFSLLLNYTLIIEKNQQRRWIAFLHVQHFDWYVIDFYFSVKGVDVWKKDVNNKNKNCAQYKSRFEKEI